MSKLSKESKQRLQQVFQCGQFVIRWGFIPTVLYLGFKRGADPGMPEPTVLRELKKMLRFLSVCFGDEDAPDGHYRPIRILPLNSRESRDTDRLGCDVMLGLSGSLRVLPPASTLPFAHVTDGSACVDHDVGVVEQD
ncbi:mitochondrial import receptor subunit TOM7 [Pimephales promelas]|nr:mitochondrial import receptor subunit TOM7 [Pimephales promelas]